MRKRRKTRYTWLPNFPTEVVADQWIVTASSGFDIAAGTGSGTSAGVVQPILKDIPQADETTNIALDSLADSIGSEYFIKRIVGKAFVIVNGIGGPNGFEIHQNAVNAGSVPSFLVTAGFYVAPEEHPAGSAIPMGFAADSDRYNPQTLDAIREPWIWRRSWILSPLNFSSSSEPFTTFAGTASPSAGSQTLEVFTLTAGNQVGLGTHPSTNARYGSVADGPHVDAKTARRVRQHERLFFTVFAHSLPIGQEIDDNIWDKVSFGYALDVRVLGGLRKARNRSSFE